MRNSLSDRIKITGSGKMMKRTMGQGHFKAKKNNRQKHNKLGKSAFAKADERVFRQQM